jgi:catechol 2,3-dioxygenase-like lactoylglutathione lyase family enzyme
MNVKQAVPFLSVADIQASLRFYVDTLGFTMTKQWIDDGALRWCWLEHGTAALMLQQFKTLPENPGAGVTLFFICNDALALYRDWKPRGLSIQRPFVGNGMWVVNLTDPDGYKVSFESETDAEEESVLEE